MNDEIDRLRQLLKGRQEEYKIFGTTFADKKQDMELIAKIKFLER